MCDKQPYETRQEVHAAIAGLVKRGARGLYSYFCNDCELYYISSAKQSSLKRRRNKKDKRFRTDKPAKKVRFTPIKVTQAEIDRGKSAIKPLTTIAAALHRFFK